MDDDPRATQVGMFPHGGDAVVRLALSKASLGRVARDKSRMHIRARVPCERQYGHAYSVRPIVHLLPWHATCTASSVQSLLRALSATFMRILSGQIRVSGAYGGPKEVSTSATTCMFSQVALSARLGV